MWLYGCTSIPHTELCLIKHSHKFTTFYTDNEIHSENFTVRYLLILWQYSDTSANEDNSFRNHIR